MLLGLLCLTHSVGTCAQVTWRRSFGGYGSDVAKSVRVTSDGNYIVCGSTGSFGAGGGDIYLTLLDPNGEIIWSKTYGGSGVEQGNCVRETADGGFIIAGLTNSFGAGGYDGYVVRTDAAGFQLWDETFGGSDWDVFYSIVIVDDGIVVAGQSYSDGSVNGDAWLIKLNDIGALDWTSISGMSGADCIESIIRTTSGKFFAAGYSSPADAHATIFENS